MSVLNKRHYFYDRSLDFYVVYTNFAKEVASVTIRYVTPIEGITEQRVSAHLFFYFLN